MLYGGWVNEGTHINAIGAHTPDSRELDEELIARSKLVVDSIDAALKEAGDVIVPLKQGRVPQNHIYAELGEITSGAKKGRVSEREVTVFKSVGLAVQDAMAAKLVYEKAIKKGVGVDVELS